MACAFFAHSEGLLDVDALDLSRKSSECTALCQCLTCIFNRFDLPARARDILLHQWPKQHLQMASLPAFNFDLNANQFKANPNGKEREESLTETGNIFEPERERDQGSRNTVRITSESVLVTSLRQSHEDLAQHRNEYAVKRPHSTTNSYGSSPVNKCYRSPAFPGTYPDAFVPEPFNSTAFSPRLPHTMGMISPIQLSLNAWWTLHPATTSPTTITTKSSPEKATSENLREVMRSDNSSPAAPSLSSPDLHTTVPKQHTTLTLKDKDSVYMQKRLKNNLAAKRSRDLRRQREDRIAAGCRHMHYVLKKAKSIRSGYLRILAANNLDRSQAGYKV